jgi:hypothetical protein
MQVLPLQQPAPQVLFSQQGWVAPPQATTVPAAHTMPLAAGDSPEARHVEPVQQPPPVQVLPGQHA